jgi:hypothetical protein
MLSAIPWITDSTTEQNIVFHCIVSKITTLIQIHKSLNLQTSLVTWTSSNDRVQYIINTAETKVAMSLHLHHVPQAVMLECRLEILSTYSSSKKPAHLIMQPHEWRSVQWCTGKWHIFGGCCERAIYMIFGWWSFGLICTKQILSYIFQIKTLF